jgi:cell division protein FtsI/penicillin-binding protein 2
VIYDRDGEILANNEPGLNVTVIPDELPRDKVKELAEAVGADAKAVQERYDSALYVGDRYSPILVKENAGRDAVTYVSERTEEFPGVSVNEDWDPKLPAGQPGLPPPRLHRRRHPGGAGSELIQGSSQRLGGREERGGILL